MTGGLIQRLVDENATRKLNQHDYRKKYDRYASRYAALESREDRLEKERERKEIQYDIFSGFIAGLSETVELPEHRVFDRCLRPLFLCVEIGCCCVWKFVNS